MSNHTIEIGRIHLNTADVRKYWVDADASNVRAYYQENNYLGSVFSLLIAGLISTFLARKKGAQPQKKYLHIETSQDVVYCFSEDEININDALIKLKK